MLNVIACQLKKYCSSQGIKTYMENNVTCQFKAWNIVQKTKENVTLLSMKQKLEYHMHILHLLPMIL